MDGKSLQDQYAPGNRCFGCGPSNEKGLRIKSFVKGDEVIAEFAPESHHEAFKNILCGGIIGTLLDCHMNWAAAHHLMVAGGLDSPPCTVTADYSIRMRRPTPTSGPVLLRARVTESTGDRATIAGTLEAGGRVTATGEGTFVAVREGHPAYHRW